MEDASQTLEKPTEPFEDDAQYPERHDDAENSGEATSFSLRGVHGFPPSLLDFTLNQSLFVVNKFP